MMDSKFATLTDLSQWQTEQPRQYDDGVTEAYCVQNNHFTVLHKPCKQQAVAVCVKSTPAMPRCIEYLIVMQHSPCF